MQKSKPLNHSNFTAAKSIKTILIAKSTAVLVLLVSLAASQPAHADEALGQMIDDSGLVISSNADGSIKEFYLSQKQLSALKIFQPSLLVGNSVIEQAAGTNHRTDLILTCAR